MMYSFYNYVVIARLIPLALRLFEVTSGIFDYNKQIIFFNF